MMKLVAPIVSLWLVGSCLPFGNLASATELAERPNVVVILTDDQGWGDLSLHGNRNLNTPTIDALARAGAQFDRFYVCPVCSPTRAEFLTGRYHPRSGVFSTSAGGERINADEMTIGQTFAAAGYATAAFGKWHNGMQHPYHPNSRGFDEYYGFCSGHWGNYFSPMLEHNGSIVRGDGFVIDDFTNRAMAFIERHQDQPFFVYLPYNTPHSPMQVPDQWWNKFKDKKLLMRHREPNREDIPHTRAALAMCENIDYNVGRLLGKLDELKLRDNTIVVYFCDNGPNGSRFNGKMKGRKGSTDEGGVRSPLFVRWPGHIAAGKNIPQISASIDLLPTLADLAGIPVTSKKPLDGVSLKPLLTNKNDDWPSRTLFSHWRGKVSVRTQQYRLDHQNKLFDIANDPGQHQDCSQQHPKITAELKQAKQTWSRDLLPTLGKEPRPFVIGDQKSTRTQLPARDGVTSGGIKRSNRFPNCSYFTNWAKTNDTISWDVEVAVGGTYEVEIYYTCPKKDIGSVIELRLQHGPNSTSNSPSLQVRITEGHDPPLLGAEHDRVQRRESYVKFFKPLRMGRISLKPGTGKLVLRALEVPGEQAMEMRLLLFTRVSD